MSTQPHIQELASQRYIAEIDFQKKELPTLHFKPGKHDDGLPPVRIPSLSLATDPDAVVLAEGVTAGGMQMQSVGLPMVAKDWETNAPKKHGKFSNKEDRILQEAIEAKVQERSIDKEDALKYLFDGRGRNKKFAGLWQEIAACLPDRSLRQVYDHVRAKFRGDVKRGPWEQPEVEELLKLHQEYPSNWKKIGERLGRLRHSCRDKFREVKDRSSKLTGKWSKEENEKFESIIRELAAEHPDIGRNMPWSIIAERMGSRTMDQCKRKWRKVNPDPLNPNITPMANWQLEDDKRLYDWMAELNADDETEINWQVMSEKFDRRWTPTQLYHHWRLRRKRVDGPDGLTLGQILSVLQSQVDADLRRADPQDRRKIHYSKKGSDILMHDNVLPMVHDEGDRAPISLPPELQLHRFDT